MQNSAAGKRTERSVWSNEWQETERFADGRVVCYVSTIDGGEVDPVPQRRMVIDLGEGKAIEIITTAVPYYPEQPERVTVRRGGSMLEFLVGQNEQDQLSSSFDPAYSLYDSQGRRVGGIRGKGFDSAVAAHYFTDPELDRKRRSGTYVPPEIFAALETAVI